MLLDDLQLDEADSSTERYGQISAVKDEFLGAKEMLDCRLDLIEKVDKSPVGWAAAAFYEKTNGLSLKSDSAKLWVEAEKSAREAKKKDSLPFRGPPVQSGKYQYPRSYPPKG